MEKNFEIINGEKNNLPLIAHLPHGSRYIPEKIRQTILLDDAGLERELLRMTDSFTPELFSGIVACGGEMFVNKTSRLVVDPERFEDDRRETMSKKGMGAVYIKTAAGGPLRLQTHAGREWLLSEYYRPYHQAFSREVQKMLDRFDSCLIVDCHSFPSKTLPYELFNLGQRPEVCIGTDRFHTPEKLAANIGEFFCQNNLIVANNMPFSGAFVPMAHYQNDKKVASIMIEVNRARYMDEESGQRNQNFAMMKKLLDKLFETIIKEWLVLSD